MQIAITMVQLRVNYQTGVYVNANMGGKVTSVQNKRVMVLTKTNTSIIHGLERDGPQK
tara:strand:+ start:366 stop:539 length:174 start_codon:yes stop_codon:yes gene_type:complete